MSFQLFQVSARAWQKLGVVALVSSLLLTQSVQPVSAISTGIPAIDRMFGGTENVTPNVVNAADKAASGNLNLDNNVGNVDQSWYEVSYLRLTGINQKDLGAVSSTTRSEMTRRYGKGAIQGFASATDALIEHAPASSTTYVAYLLNSAKIVPQAQAQGLGFAALDPILNTWIVFRNLAYVFYVVIFLVIGFMVMFRAQLGKTAVTVQSALPSIVVSLIFVTFSYAIAGFLIDAMYLLMYLLVGMFPSADSAEIMDYNFLELGQKIIMGDGTQTGAFSSFADAVDELVQGSLNWSGGPEKAAEVLGGLAGITLALILAIAILVGVFKLFFELLKTYVTVILLISFSPLLLMLGAIPGNSNAFQSWIRDLAGNLMAFPTTLLIIIVFRMFVSSADEIAGSATTIESSGFLPPFLIGRGYSGALTTLVGIGIVLIMPELIQQMKKALGVSDGIFTKLAKDMVGNFGKNFKTADPAFPIIGGLAGRAAGSAAGAYEHLRKNKHGYGSGSGQWSLTSLRNAMSQGEKYKVGDNEYTFGGAKSWGQKGKDVGQKVRITLDRIAENRYLDPEDINRVTDWAGGGGKKDTKDDGKSKHGGGPKV